MKKLLFYVAVAAALCGCNSQKDEVSDVALNVYPDKGTTPTLLAGEQMLYSVMLATSHDYVAQLTVSSFDPLNGTQTIFEEAFHQKEISLKVPFKAPVLNRDSVLFTLTFEARDDQGNRGQLSRNVLVLNKAIAMAEKTGIVLYDPDLDRPDALNFAEVSEPFNLAQAPDSVRADLYLHCNPGFAQIAFRSATNAKFLRSNSFDYASATPQGIQAVFESSVKTDNLSDIRANDIVLVGHGSQAAGVMFVNAIDRTEGYMQLSFKGIER